VDLPSRNWLRGFSYLFVIVVIFGLGISPFLEAKVFYTQKEAFRLAFPEADRFERKTYVLTAEQVEAIETASRSNLGSKLVTIQTAWRGETLLGHLQIDVHIVRTQSEGVLVALDEKGRVSQVRVLAFHEPLDYLPGQRWYDGFKGKGPADAIRVGHDVDAVTGATLTTQATSAAIRRTLAYYKILLRS
jgi:transcriptional regulator of nitric oxide reductase